MHTSLVNKKRWQSTVFITLLGLIFLPFNSASQTYTMGPEHFMSWEDFVTDFFEDKDEDNESSGNSELLDILEELHLHPVNINQAIREDLLQIPFLTEAQADSILDYRKKKRLLHSLGELQWISGIPYQTRCQLSLFVYAGDTLHTQTSIGHRFYKGHHDIVTRYDFPLYQRAGYKKASTDELKKHPSRYYLGNSMANTVRYRYKWSKDVAYGMTLQKDSGEPFAKQNNYPYDYTSAYFFYRSPRQRYSFHLGDYHINMGEGLLLGHAFFNSPIQIIHNYGTRQKCIRPHTSSDEINFLRGAAVSIDWSKQWKMEFFGSYRKLDGKKVNDSIVSLKTDGQHRTITEINNRRTFGNMVFGSRINFQKLNWHTALNAYWSQYTHTIAPKQLPYNKYYLRGKSAAGFSSDYSWHSRRWSFQGETSMDKSFHLATTNTFHFSPNSNTSFLLHLHSFSSKYVAPLGNTLQESSHIQNEHAVILGTSFQPFRRVNVTSYLNYFYHPRPTFTAHEASHGLEYFIESDMDYSRRLAFEIRYKLKMKQQNISGYDKLMEYVCTHRSRLTCKYHTKKVNLNVAADIAFVTRQTSPTTMGWMVSARNKINISKKIVLHSFAATFFTDDYASRLYAYEPQLQYAANFPTFAYHGARLAGLLQWKFHQKGYVAIRYGWTHYFNRNQISSGAQLIDSPTKQDLSVQLAWRF